MMKSIIDNVLEALEGENNVRMSVADRIVEHMKKGRFKEAKKNGVGLEEIKEQERGLSRINDEASDVGSKKSSERYKSEVDDVFDKAGKNHSDEYHFKKYNEDDEPIEINKSGDGYANDLNDESEEEVVNRRGSLNKEEENPFGNKNEDDFRGVRKNKEGMPFDQEAEKLNTPDSDNSPIQRRAFDLFHKEENKNGKSRKGKENSRKDSNEDIRTSDISDEEDKKPALKFGSNIGRIANPFKHKAKIVKVIKPTNTGCHQQTGDYTHKVKPINQKQHKPIRNDSIIRTSVSHVSCGRFVSSKLNDMCNYVEEQTNCLII